VLVYSICRCSEPVPNCIRKYTVVSIVVLYFYYMEKYLIFYGRLFVFFVCVFYGPGVETMFSVKQDGFICFKCVYIAIRF
jgi:recombinational DNA repair protein (RecF pathway)